MSYYVHTAKMTINPGLYYPDSGHTENNWSSSLLTDLSCPLPDDDSTKRFSVSPEITGRVMTMTKHKVATLEFLGPDGTRIDSIEDLQVLVRARNGQLVPVSFASRPFPSSNHLYIFPIDDKVYEVHFHRLICVFSFPHTPHIDPGVPFQDNADAT
ncbi:hypothetical protein EDD22DRAFT_872377 [Suillus occidentalis]|nr:hypothetical protein EDD22DRAFT_872377 [Suillus occidentalis]